MEFSSSSNSQRKYDVFVSFRGKDTRRSFVSYLVAVLKDKKIEVFIDDKLKTGDAISPALLKAIEGSDISLIIFSKCYADSIWCLRELEKIVEGKENSNDHIIVPIFYDVDPSTVRHQTGSYGEAFAKHEMSLRHDLSKLESWRTALKKVADLSGLVFSEFRNDSELVERIVLQVLLRLREIRPPNVLTGLIGIHKQIAQLESLLGNRKHNVHIIGIWGMGGIGKTTMAGVIFNKVYHEYEGCYFLENVREKWRECSGRCLMRNNLISELLGKEDLGTTSPIGLPDHVRRRLCQKKVLVVLDDVDDSDQLEDLTGGYDWFGKGSTIIMTSRDKSVFNKYCDDQMYEAKGLNLEQSLQLFSLRAFKEGCLKMEDIDHLSKRFIHYANGNPLALKVLGKTLCGKSEDYWNDQSEKLERMPFPKIHDVLKLSYDTLDQTEKEIFLFVACSLKNFEEEVVKSLLDSHLHFIVGLATLQDKALITKSNQGCIYMHDLLREMGRQIVREESPNNPGEHRHLWYHEDICEVLKKNLGTKSIKSISLQCEKVDKIHLNANAFKRMTNLKFLKFKCKDGLSISDKTLDLISTELRYFDWEWYPLEIPPKLCLQNLVEFHMPNSKLERLWDGIQDLGNLKVINLTGSKHLKELPDSILSSRSLERLVLWDCSNLMKLSLSTSLEQLKILLLQGTHIVEFSLPITQGFSYAITELHLCDCKFLESLPESIKHLSNLRALDLSSCRQLKSIPELPPSIEYMCAYGCESLEVFAPTFPISCGRQLYDLRVDLRNCEKLGHDLVRTIAKNFIYFITMVAVYQLPVKRWALIYLPVTKISEVIDILKRPCPVPETIQGSPNTDLMPFIFCFELSKLTALCLSCSCYLQASSGERILCAEESFFIWGGDSVALICRENFNLMIMNGIKKVDYHPH